MLRLAALAEAAAPYGIGSFDNVLKPVCVGICHHCGKCPAAFLRPSDLSFLSWILNPSMDARLLQTSRPFEGSQKFGSAGRSSGPLDQPPHPGKASNCTTILPFVQSIFVPRLRNVALLTRWPIPNVRSTNVIWRHPVEQATSLSLRSGSEYHASYVSYDPTSACAEDIPRSSPKGTRQFSRRAHFSPRRLRARTGLSAVTSNFDTHNKRPYIGDPYWHATYCYETPTAGLEHPETIVGATVHYF